MTERRTDINDGPADSLAVGRSHFVTAGVYDFADGEGSEKEKSKSILTLYNICFSDDGNC